jgi:4-amino-4-deoxy-L-arabinose transferase-like glycosyltransferase
MEGDCDSQTRAAATSVWREPAFYLLAVLVAAIYLSRLATLPIVGEESRWARGAAQMLETGDWIVLRQQGHVFPERPPMTCWSMAVAALAWGDLDLVAIRLPSVIAVLLTSLLIYVYARGFLSSTGALVGGLTYATFGQVLQIGRHGESEALFTLFLGGAILVWHLGYSQGWTKLGTWTTAYTLTALAALCKGPQGPIYFVAVVFVYLTLRRDWRWLFDWRHAAGMGVFAAIIACWQVPYYLMTDWTAVQDTWAGLAKDRFLAPGLVAHMISYPFEILVCLLPWSPLLLMFISRKFRDSLGDLKTPAIYLATALAVTFPSVWLAALARGRYYMPLYPCLAVLIAVVVHRCATLAVDAPARRVWKGFLVLGSLTSISLGIGAVVVLVLPRDIEVLRSLPPLMLIALAAIGFATASIQVWAARDSGLTRTAVASVAFAALLGFTYTGPAINFYSVKWHDCGPDVAKLRSMIPEPDAMISLGPINPGFAYHYQTLVQELPWPTKADDLPKNVEYFFVMQYAADTPDTHQIGRGRSWEHVSGQLPFDWEEVARLPMGRRLEANAEQTLVLARVCRPDSVALQPESPDAETPTITR